MSGFDYTSGNPNNLVGNHAASMSDIQGPFTDLKTFLNNRIGAIPSLVSSLPAGSTDGQEIYYLADSTNGVVWHLRYRSASASTYKWEFLGGAPMYGENMISGTASLSSGAWGAIASDPSVTVPLAGDYIAVAYCSSQIAAGGTVAMGIKVGATEPTISVNTAQAIVNANEYASLTNERKFTGVAAATVIAQRYWQSTGSSANYSRHGASLAVRPVRVG